MKTPILLSLLALANTASAQESAALHLWADAQRLGPVQQVITGTGLVSELRYELQGKVSSLEVGDGYTVTLYDREDADTHRWYVLIGPCEVHDLETLPMLSLKGNWDDAVAAVKVERTGCDELQAPVVAEVRE